MISSNNIPVHFPNNRPLLALAPMQDVTDLPFWKVMSRYGGADLYYTEYFRVYDNSRLNKTILRSIQENPTGKPVIGQMIGEHIPSLTRIARELAEFPIIAVDLNLGCPAPVVCNKNAGGGLLRNLEKTRDILAALRDALGSFPLTVKTRIGFEDPQLFEDFLQVFIDTKIDLLTIHGRTVKQMYRGVPDYDLIAKAVQTCPFPVLANGAVDSASKAADVFNKTQAPGLMIGRAAIRNPWIFTQTRQWFNGEPLTRPTGIEMVEYLKDLFETVRPEGIQPGQHVQKIKKYMNYVGMGLEPTGNFLHQIRRVKNEQEFWSVILDFLDHHDPLPLEPSAFEMSRPL